MKKNHARDQNQQWQKRRFTLSRETIKALDDPAQLGLARGGLDGDDPKSCSSSLMTHDGFS